MSSARSAHLSRRTISRWAALCVCLVLAACSGSGEVVRQESNAGAFRILPPSPLVGNELSLAFGADAGSPRSTAAFASDESDGYSIIWSVNGNKVARGHSLPAGLVRRGDRVSVRFEGDPVSHERAAVVIGNSPPEVRNVSVTRSEQNPNFAVALYDSHDPDGDRLSHHFEWTVDGEPVADHDSARLSLEGRNRGQVIAVRVSASDGEQANSRASTPARFENHPPEIQIAGVPRIVDRNGTPWAELDVITRDVDGDSLDIRVTGDGVKWDRAAGVLSWRLEEGTEPFDVNIVVTDAQGGSAERRTRLKR